MTRSAYHLIETAPPGAEPLTLEDAKLHLRLTHDADDNLLTSLIMTARMICEADTGLALVTRGYSLWLDRWPQTRDAAWWDGLREGAQIAPPDAILLPRPPLVSITGVYLYTEDGQESTLPAETYHVDTIARPGRLVLRQQATTPAALRSVNGIEIRYLAGFGTTPQSVPAPLRQGMKQMVAHLYTARGDAPEAALHTSGAAALFQPYRLMRLA